MENIGSKFNSKFASLRLILEIFLSFNNESTLLIIFMGLIFVSKKIPSIPLVCRQFDCFYLFKWFIDLNVYR